MSAWCVGARIPNSVRMRRMVLLSLIVPVLVAWIKIPGGDAVAPTQASSQEILGLWSRFAPEKEGDRQRFYYFHTGGIGLFRYGKMGLSYTQTFKYSVDAERITLTFNKSGAEHVVPYAVRDGRLTLTDDPKMGGEQVYTKRGLGKGAGYHAFDHPLARLWTEVTKDSKGQVGFRMYQLQAPTIDGRGVGWYHEGDFFEWSTETLQYRRTGDRLELRFPVRAERFVTTVTDGEADGTRTLRLDEDPRNFWHPRTYADGGPGFTMSVAGVPLPYHVPGHGAYAGHGCPHGGQ